MKRSRAKLSAAQSPGGRQMARRIHSTTVSVGALAVALASASLAHAADATSDPVQTAAAATVAPVTITAERRTTNLQTAPVVATVLQGQSLQAAGIQTLDDLQFHTPSLTVA